MRRLGYVVLVTSLWCEKIGAQNYEAPTQSRVGSSSLQSDNGAPIGAKTNQGIKISVRDSTISYVLSEIARQANIKLLLDEGSSEAARRISINISTSSPIDAISRVLAGTGLEPKMASDGTILVRKRTSANSSSRSAQEDGGLFGQVVDSATGKPIAGATVEIQRLSKRLLTTDKGTFVFTGIPPGSHVVTIRLIGYKSTSKTVVVESGNKAMLNVVLPAAASVLSGVVTTVTGVQRKVEVGNDITTIDVEEIIQKNPVSSVTDLLATRVPGVIVGKASGEPGAKTSIRIRGTGSLRASNEPIIVVDGVQVLSERNESETVMATSPIDQLDVNSISKIEVLKGPSAVALYGSNAANGVIVITTKRGQDGPARWIASTRLSRENMPGKWPLNYFAWGEDLTAGLGTVQCPRTAWGAFPDCRYDSTTVYQILNDPRTTVFGTGTKKEFSMGVSGGNRQFTYAFSGSYSSAVGLMKLPDADFDLLRTAGIGVTSWQRRPQGLDSYNGTATFGLGISDQSDLSYSTRFGRNDRRTSPLIQALAKADGLEPSIAVYDRDGATLGVGSGVLVKVPDFKASQDIVELQFANSARYRKTLWSEITFDATAGVDLSSGRETYLLKPGDYCPLNGPINVAFGNCVERIAGPDGLGAADYRSYRTSTTVTDFRINASGTPKGHRWLNVTPYIGIDGNSNTGAKNGIAAAGLPVGGHGIQGATKTGVLADEQGTRRTVGMFAEARVQIANRFWMPLSIRTDAGNAIGSNTTPLFPRLSFSYLASDQPSFRAIPILGMLPELRLRTAFGVAGRQPGLADKYRTFNFTYFPIDGVSTQIADVNSVGNTKLSPETSREVELGFDATIFDNARGRVSGTFTLVRKQTSNLLETELLPPSLGTIRSRISNVGDLVNNAIEVSLEGYAKIGFVDWSTSNLISTLSNRLVRLNNGRSVLGGDINDKSAVQPLYRVGYPVNGLWAYPVAGYVDGNRDGILQANEVVYGDSVRFMGSPFPRFTLTNNNQVTLGAQVTLATTISYEDGSAPSMARRLYYSQFSNDPTLSLEDQVRLNYDAQAITYRVSTLRFNSLQMTYSIPTRFTSHYLSARSLQVAVSGSNLGLWSTFKGKESGAGRMNPRQTQMLASTPILPTPRTWGISMRIQ